MALFHYTDLIGVFSILNAPALRCTDLRYLNDRTEFQHGMFRSLESLPQAPYGLYHNFEKVEESKAFVRSGSYGGRFPVYGIQRNFCHVV